MSVDLIKDGAVATVVLNRPEKYNAMSQEMKDQLYAICQELNVDRGVRAVLLTGEGQNFCSGGDVSTMGQTDLIAGRQRCQHAHRVILSLFNLEKPVVSAVRGWVSGAGLAMMLCTDLILASETARFSAIFKNVGLAPDSGAVYFLTQYLGINRAKEMVMTARPVAADEALEAGLVTRVVPDDRLMDEAMSLVTELAAGPTYALGMAKKMFQSMAQPTLEQLLEIECWVQPPILMSHDHKEGVAAFLEKRPARFTGE
jgi:2-(1,2-epoxy-1,2-dihydrophenyl)acetyl-CoA isomerase